MHDLRRDDKACVTVTSELDSVPMASGPAGVDVGRIIGVVLALVGLALVGVAAS